MVFTAIITFLIWLINSLVSLLPSLPTITSLTLQPLFELVEFIGLIGRWLIGDSFSLWISLVFGLLLLKPVWVFSLFLYRKIRG